MTDIELESPLTEEQIEEAEQKIETLQERVEGYREKAQQINDRKVDNDPRDYVPLDGQPFGEELIRTEEIPGRLAAVSDLLDSLREESLTTAQKIEFGQQALEVIEDAESTLEDCTPVPDDEDEDDGLPY